MHQAALGRPARSEQASVACFADHFVPWTLDGSAGAGFARRFVHPMQNGPRGAVWGHEGGADRPDGATSQNDGRPYSSQWRSAGWMSGRRRRSQSRIAQ